MQKLPSTGSTVFRLPFAYSKLLLQTLSASTSSIKHSNVIVIYKSNDSIIMNLAEILHRFF